MGIYSMSDLRSFLFYGILLSFLIAFISVLFVDVLMSILSIQRVIFIFFLFQGKELCQMLGFWILLKNHMFGRGLTLKVIDLLLECEFILFMLVSLLLLNLLLKLFFFSFYLKRLGNYDLL